MTDRLKRRVREIVQIPSPPGNKIGRAFDITIVSLILLNTAAVIVETLPVFDAYAGWFRIFELGSVGVFIGEYALRLWSITAEPEYAHPLWGRLRWMVTPFAVLDVLAIAPIFLFALDLRFLRVLRVLRILKLGRYSESVDILGNVLKRSRRELLTSFFVVMLGLILTSSLMYYAERDAQPAAFASIPHAMWWSIVALSTTGYGDIVPITAWGRILGGVTAILGVATIALPVGILSSSFVQEIEARRRRKEAMSAHLLSDALNERLAARRCPHCGHDLWVRSAPEKG